MSSNEDTELSKTPDSKNANALSEALGQTLYSAYVDLVDTQGASFKNIDSNSNGYLSEIELVGALGVEPTARHLLNNLPQIEKQLNDGDRGRGITNDDLELNLLHAIQGSGGNQVGSLANNDRYKVEREIDCATGEISRLSIVDKERGLSVSFADDQLRISRGNDWQQVGAEDYDAALKKELGVEFFNAYRDYHDGGLAAFRTIDYDGNETLDEKELNEFLILSKNSKDPAIQRQHEAAGHILREMDKGLKDEVDDEWFSVEDGVSMDDLAQRLTRVATSDATLERVKERLHNGATGIEVQNERAEVAHLLSVGLYTMSAMNRDSSTDVTVNDPLRKVKTLISTDDEIKTQKK